MNIIEKKKRQMGQGGFTLIELLVVIAILAVLAGLAVIGIGAMRDNAEKQACKADVDTFQTAVEAYNVSNNAYPAALGDVVGNSNLVRKSGKYFSTMNLASGVVTNSACA